ncbi:DinB family protein [Streptomyces sp. NBC_01260]|uniref:DinB family protein n=1 Tax=unclassified Streptomyces TaxID=2593676 RepID=UPI000F54D9AD|nr:MULTISPECIES: DinB family protein [unclassified Streptomyces]RPK46143.1 DinB superfamily protein [Streptomyces sp. ADI92-24]
MSSHVPYTGSEKESLHTALDRHRDVVLWKLEGLDDEQLRRPMTPTGTNLLGLVKHLATVEYGWFCESFGYEVEKLWFDSATEDMTIAPDETTAGILAFYERARAAADRAIEKTDLNVTGTSWNGRTVSMRWVLIHMLEDVVRHAGHMDIVRELLDGSTGDHPRPAPSGT